MPDSIDVLCHATVLETLHDFARADVLEYYEEVSGHHQVLHASADQALQDSGSRCIVSKLHGPGLEHLTCFDLVYILQLIRNPLVRVVGIDDGNGDLDLLVLFEVGEDSAILALGMSTLGSSCPAVVFAPDIDRR